MSEKQKGYEELTKLYIFGEIFRFFKESTGLAMSLAYFILLLSSMVHLHFLFDVFDLPVLSYMSFEDILATPLKNPQIILTFLTIAAGMLLADVINRFSAGQQLKYREANKTWWLKLYLVVMWVPRTRATNIAYMLALSVTVLMLHIVIFAEIEAKDIKAGEINQVEITLADSDEKITAGLLGASSNYLFTYQGDSKKTVVYYVEAVKNVQPLAKTQELSDTNTRDSSVDS